MKFQNPKRNLILLYPFVIWGLGIFFYFYIYIIEVSPSVMTKQFMGYFHINAKEMGNLAACFFYAYFVMQIPIGLLLDKFGVKKVLTVSIITTTLGTLIVATSNSFFIAELGRFIAGLGAASAAIGCLKITAIWFPERLFAILAGFMLSVAMIGSVIGQAPLSIIIHRAGWRNTLYYCSILGFVIAAVFFITARDRKKENNLNIQKAPFSFLKSIKDVTRQKQTWFLSIYSGFAFTPVMVFGGLWGVSFLRETHNFTETYAASLTSLVFVGFALGAPMWGWISEKTKRRLPYLYFATILPMIFILLLICLPASTSNILVIAILLLFGFFSSAFLLCFTMIKEVNNLMFVATAIAFMNTFNAALGSISDPIIGHILDLGWDGKLENGVMIFSSMDYKIAMLAIPITLIISTCMLPFIKETHCKQLIK